MGVISSIGKSIGKGISKEISKVIEIVKKVKPAPTLAKVVIPPPVRVLAGIIPKVVAPKPTPTYQAPVSTGIGGGVAVVTPTPAKPSIIQRIGEAYKKVDIAVGGILPAGVSVAEAKAEAKKITPTFAQPQAVPFTPTGKGTLVTPSVVGRTLVTPSVTRAVTGGIAISPIVIDTTKGEKIIGGVKVVPEIPTPTTTPKVTWVSSYSDTGTLLGFQKEGKFIPESAVPKDVKGTYRLEDIDIKTTTSKYGGGTDIYGKKIVVTPETAIVESYQFIDKKTGQQLARALKIGSEYDVTATKSGVRLKGTLTSEKAIVGWTEEDIKREQETLKKQVEEVVGEKLTYKQAEDIINKALEKEKATWTVGATLKNIVSMQEKVLSGEYKYISPEDLRYVTATPMYVKVGKEKEVMLHTHELQQLSDVWKGSPLSLFKTWWRETGVPSGAREPAMVGEHWVETKEKYIKSPIGIIPVVSLAGITYAGIKEAGAQRLAGATLKEQQKYVSEEYGKLTKEFEKKYPVDVKIDTQEKWNEYKTDYLALKQKTAELGFYQPDEKTLANPVLEKVNVPMYYKQVQAVKQKYGDTDWRVRTYQTGRIMGDIGEAVVIGGITYGTGVAGVVGRGTSYLLGGSKVLTYGLGAGLTAGVVSEEALGLPSATLRTIFAGQPFEFGGGYAQYKKLGMSGWEGAVEGGLAGAGKIGGFIIGASGGKLSPIQYQAFGGKEIKGEMAGQVKGAVKEVSLFGKPVVTWQEEAKGSLSILHYPKAQKLDWTLIAGEGFEPMSKTQANFLQHYIKSATDRLATEGVTMDKSLKIMKQLYNVQIHDTPQIDFSKSRAFSELKPAQQEIFKNWLLEQAKTTRGVKGFVSAVSDKGLERIYGSSTISAEKGFEKNLMRTKGEYGDFDINFRDTAMDKAQQLYKTLSSVGKNVRWQEGTGLIEIKADGKWIHLADLHGSDLPELMLKGSPYGFGTQAPKTYLVEGKGIAGQKLGESLTQKGGSVLTARITPKGQFYFAPEPHRTKDVADFVSIAERLNLEASQGKINQIFGISGKTSENIAQLKGLLKTNFPDVMFEGSPYEQVFAQISTPPPSRLPVISLATMGWDIPSPKITPSMQAGIEAMSSKALNIEISKALKSPSVASISATAVSKVSPYAYPSVSPSVSVSVSPSVYVSPSVSPSVSISPSGSVSVSPSPSVSPYPSPSISVSPSPSVSVSPYPSPYVVQPPVPPPPLPFLFGWGEGKPRREAGKGKKRKIYTPDFTAQALGINLGKQSQAQIKKLLEKTFIGLEIRPSL